MVRISKHVAASVQLLAKCGELDTKLSAVLVKHTFFQGQTQKWERAANLDGRHFDGCVPNIQQTLQLMDCDIPRIKDPKTVVNVLDETLESTT